MLNIALKNLLEKKVATTESLGNKEKGRHFCLPVYFGSPKLSKLHPDDFCSADIKCSFCESSINQEPWRSDLYVLNWLLIYDNPFVVEPIAPTLKIIDRSDCSSLFFIWGSRFGSVCPKNQIQNFEFDNFYINLGPLILIDLSLLELLGLNHHS